MIAVTAPSGEGIGAAIAALLIGSCAPAAPPAAPAVPPVAASAPPHAPYRFIPSGSGLVIWGGYGRGSDGQPLAVGAAGVHAGDVATYVEIECTRDDIATRSRGACAASSTAPEPYRDRWLPRLLQCFRVVRAAPPPVLLARANASFRGLDLTRPLHEYSLPLTAADLARSDLAFLGVVLRHDFTFAESRPVGCESAAGHPCDPIGSEPTGRMLPSHQTWFIASGPVPLTEPVFPSATPPIRWIEVADPRFHLASYDGEPVVRERRLLARLEAVDLAGEPPELRAAVTADLAILAYKTGDRALGDRAVDALQALVDLRAFDARPLALDETLPNLQRIRRGEWALADPCARP